MKTKTTKRKVTFSLSPEIIEFLEENFENKSKYDGYWKNNMKHGRGTEVYYDGSRYEGEWKENQKDGRGNYFFQSGSSFIGEFKYGQFVIEKK